MTTKERVWLAEYLICWNATEAARRAGYKYPNVLGPQKLKKFADKIEEQVKVKVMSADETLLRLSQLARCEYAEYLQADGGVDLKRMLADGKGHLIKKLRYDSNNNLTIEFYDAQQALVTIARCHGLFEDNVNIKDKSVEIRVVYDNEIDN